MQSHKKHDVSLYNFSGCIGSSLVTIHEITVSKVIGNTRTNGCYVFTQYVLLMSLPSGDAFLSHTLHTKKY